MAWIATAAAACQGTDEGAPALDDRKGSDVQVYLENLPSAVVVDSDAAGTPNFIKGTLGFVAIEDDPRLVDMTEALRAIAPVFQANADDLVLTKAYTDNIGDQHFRFRQTKNDLEVLGNELILHVRDGFVYAANGSARDDADAPAQAELDAAAAIAAARDNAAGLIDAMAGGDAPLAYYQVEGGLALVYQVEVTGALEDSTPVHDTVLVNALDGSIVGRMPHIHTAKNRAMHNLNGGSTLPGTLVRSEGQAPVADTTVNTNYDRLGSVYDCYSALFGRDSWNAAGGILRSSVHYSTNYCNAFWNGSQMAYGDGNASQGCGNLAISMDVTAHEITHGVTQAESNLTYSGESGGLNESLSDVFGAVCEWYADGQVLSADTWLIGEDVLAPYLRKMSDPAADNVSKDFWVSGVGSVDVHYSSGISNLAFYLLSQGGTHPRGKTTVNVTGIGINKAAQIFYRANRDLLTASSNFAAAKTATEQAAAQLGYTAAEQASVTAAWQAVGVGGTTPPPTTTPLTNGVAVTGISGATGSEKLYSLVVPSGQSTLTFVTSGGTGDVDLYVKSGSAPTTSTYDCRPYLGGNAETCTFSSPVATTWYVMLRGYSAYSGVSLTGTYSGGGGTCSGTLTNGATISLPSTSTGGQVVHSLCVPAGQTSVGFQISGGTGDADLYVKRDATPTDTVYDCRPYLNGNAETCTFNSPAAGKYYVRVKAYTAFSGASLKSKYPWP